MLTEAACTHKLLSLRGQAASSHLCLHFQGRLKESPRSRDCRAASGTYRGKCDLPYIREEELGDRLSKILHDIHIPDAVLAQLRESLLTDKGREEEIRT